MVVRLRGVGKTWWGETEYTGVDSGRKVRYCWATKLFYYVDSGDYIFDGVEVTGDGGV